MDTLLSMLGIAGAECDRSIPSAAVVYVTQNEELHAHAAHKTFRMMKVGVVWKKSGGPTSGGRSREEGSGVAALFFFFSELF